MPNQPCESERSPGLPGELPDEPVVRDPQANEVRVRVEGRVECGRPAKDDRHRARKEGFQHSPRDGHVCPLGGGGREREKNSK